MAVDIFSSENSSSTPPSSAMNDNYSGMTRQILEQRPQQQNNNSYNNEQYYSYNNSWVVNSQPSSCVLTAYQPCYPATTSTTASARTNSTVLLNMRTTQQLQQHSNSQTQVTADSQSATSDVARFLQEWSPTTGCGSYGSSYSTTPNVYGSSTYPWSKSTSVPQTSDSSTYSSSGRSLSHEGDEVACVRSMTNAKRPRVTFTNKQIVELEKEFHYNK